MGNDPELQTINSSNGTAALSNGYSGLNISRKKVLELFPKNAFI